MAGFGVNIIGTQGYRLPRGIAELFIDDVGYEFGDVENLALAIDITRDSRYSNESATRRKVYDYITEINATVALTFAQIGTVAQAMSYMSFGAKYSQPAVAARTYTRRVKPGTVMRLEGNVRTTITAVAIGAAAGGTALDPTLYRKNELGGTVFFNPTLGENAVDWTGVQRDADGSFLVTVSYSAAAVSSDEELAYGVFGGGGIRGLLRVTEDVLPGNGRIPRVVELWDVVFYPTGDNTLIGGDGLKQIQVEGEIYAVNGKPVGQELGWDYPLIEA